MPRGLAVPLLVAFYLGILTLPVAAAWLQGLPPRKWQFDLSSGLALCAFAGIMMEFLLSGRVRAVSYGIGIDATMRIHQLMARAFTLALLAHPFLYSIGGVGRETPWDVSRQHSLDFGFLAVGTGLIAWMALFVLVLLGIFREQRSGSYEAWRAWHGICALIVAIAGTVHTVNSGRYSADPFLFWFWILLLGVALAVMAWIYLVKPLLKLRHPYLVRSVTRVADRTWEVAIAPDGGAPLPFQAGQFVWLNIGHSAFSIHENPFSIASAPTEKGGLSFVIKEVGDFTRSLNRVEPGTRAFIDGPYGHMTVDGRDGAGIVFYGGGVGIAPLLSILRDLRNRGEGRPLLLLYGNRTADQIVCRDEFDAMAQDLDLEVAYFLSEPPAGWHGQTGMIDAAAMDAVFKGREMADWLHVICGPLAMIEGIEATLRSRGVPADRVISERFYYD